MRPQVSRVLQSLVLCSLLHQCRNVSNPPSSRLCLPPSSLLFLVFPAVERKSSTSLSLRLPASLSLCCPSFSWPCKQTITVTEARVQTCRETQKHRLKTETNRLQLKFLQNRKNRAAVLCFFCISTASSEQGGAALTSDIRSMSLSACVILQHKHSLGQFYFCSSCFCTDLMISRSGEF